MERNKNDTPPQKATTQPPTTQQTLRRPVQIIKKHSGPLDSVLGELEKSEAASSATGAARIVNASIEQIKSATVTKQSPLATRRRSTLKEKEKKRERWLLTRKTWRYMTDAGRKLIPEGTQNRPEDVPKIEAHFQKICALEPHFVLWRRKYSYPGAMRNSKKRLKQLLQHTGQKSQYALEQEEINNADMILELLHSHLKLDETIKTDTLLGTKTEGPHQTNSPSAQRLKPLTRSIRRKDGSVSLRGPGFLPPCTPAGLQQQQSETEQLLQRLLRLSRSSTLPETMNLLPPEQINVSLLNDNVTLKRIYNALKKQQLHRILSKHSMPSKLRTNLSHSTSMLSLLHFDSSASPNRKSNTASQSFSTKPPLVIDTSSSSSPSKTPTTTANSSYDTKKQYQATVPAATSQVQPTIPLRQRQRKPPTSLNLSDNSNALKKGIRLRQSVPEKFYNSCGTQTNFIPLSEIKRLAAEYKELKREEQSNEGAREGGSGTTDDEGDKQANFHTMRRKSSIDNEDVSQSVSDTIKRYLRMARKKSVHDENANRFKRVNYDRNLRNIQAKGEINPPGMDEDCNKAVQTLDAWALITLDFIRGDVNSGVLEIAHKDWQKALDERLRRKQEYEQKINQQTANQQIGPCQSASSCSSSAPTSPLSNQSPTMANIASTSSSSSTCDARATISNANTSPIPGLTIGENNSPVSGIFHSGSQFLANLWHNNTAVSNPPSSITSEPQPAKHDLLADDTEASNRIDMKKSKSLSHIGHYVSTKLLKGHTKSNPKLVDSSLVNPANTAGLAKWSRTDKCSWKSVTGEHIVLRDTAFHLLTELEAKMVREICIERIIELDIGIDLCDLTEMKPAKKHALTKMRAMTTSFFDIGKKDSSSNNLSIFGNTLEECVLSDKKNAIANLSVYTDRGSRNSIVSLFRSGSRSGRTAKTPITSEKLKESVRSCENLPTESQIQIGETNAANNNNNTSPAFGGNYFEHISKYKNISRSQNDCRRYSQDNSEDGNSTLDSGSDVQIRELNVPKFVKCCISFLEENGLHKVGIFRVSTSKKKIKQLRDSFHTNIDTYFSDDTCPHNVATLLKEFLRDLPEPLLSNRLYKAFLKTQKIRNRRLQLEALSHLVKLLPPAHFDTLYVLLKFLAKVAASSDDICDNKGSLHLTGNKMDSNNLATVFAPNILRCTVNSKSLSADQTQSSREQESIDDTINVIRIMIDHYEELFQVPAEILDIIFTHLLEVDPEKLNAICDYHKTITQNFIQFY